MNKIKLTLKKSLIGRKPKHIEIAKQLGLNKINRSSVFTVSPSLLGLVNKIDFLLEVEELSS